MAKRKIEVVDERGVQPGYTSINRGRSLVHYRIGKRPLTLQESIDQTWTGLSDAEVRKMTPKKLRRLANSGGISEELLLGC